MSNPFSQDMVTLQLPAGMGSMLSVGGFSLQADKNNCISVPKKFVPDLMAQGLTEWAGK
jgi:hypothetical protein